LHFFGSHTSADGGIQMAVRRAARAGMRALQVFSAKPQFYGDNVTVRAERAERFASAVNEVGFDRRMILVHAAYVLNAASPEPDKYARSRHGLARELERTTTLGVLGFCFHPGSAGASDPAGAIERIAEAMTHAIETVPGSARILIENTAGAGRTMGRTAEEIARMISLVPAHLRHRTGYGLDTCHLFASGHDIAASATALSDVLDRFTETVGGAPAFFHLNDSEGEMGSNRDRHALIGEGRIGAEPFRWLLSDARSQDVPLILETPQARSQVADDDESPDDNDVRMLQVLGEMEA
jgi:deoxyribonuclease IV